jgi:hypothetical protein
VGDRRSRRREKQRHTLALIHLAATDEAERRADAQRREHEAAVEVAVATLVAEEMDSRNAVTDAQATAIDHIATDEANRREAEAQREREAAITSAVAALEIDEADGREALAENEATTVSSMAQTLMVAVDASRRDAEAAHQAALASAIAALVVEEAFSATPLWTSMQSQWVPPSHTRRVPRAELGRSGSLRSTRSRGSAARTRRLRLHRPLRPWRWRRPIVGWLTHSRKQKRLKP